MRNCNRCAPVDAVLGEAVVVICDDWAMDIVHVNVIEGLSLVRHSRGIEKPCTHVPGNRKQRDAVADTLYQQRRSSGGGPKKDTRNLKEKYHYMKRWATITNLSPVEKGKVGISTLRRRLQRRGQIAQ
ncbi:hypothetical protein E2542_SST23859 [Spatholobus suberectus]|nr:hypothetical protein E2542_SST23859 [Spatholobus suberectus]